MEKIVARALILDDQNRVLLGQRARGVGAGQWGLIGGKPDPGETMEQTIIREVKEELGVDFTPQFYLEEVDNTSDPQNSWRVFYFTGPISGTISLDPQEIAQARFVSKSDLDTLDIAFNHKDKLRQFFS